jgi:hypothetical protein
MALINYTGSITLRQTKGSALTFQELDTNFNYLNSGSIGGTYLPYTTIIQQNLLINNGDGFGNILVGTVSSTLSITASQLVTLDTTASPSELKFVTASLNNSGSFLGIALETKAAGQEIKVLTEGYYSVYSNASATPGFFSGTATIAGVPIYFSGSSVTTTKPATAALTRPLGFCLNTEPNLNQIKYIKFSPSSFTLG